VIILITDGDNNAGNLSPLQAAGIAKDLGIKVFTILIGKGGRVPYPTGPTCSAAPRTSRSRSTSTRTCSSRSPA